MWTWKKQPRSTRVVTALERTCDLVMLVLVTGASTLVWLIGFAAKLMGALAGAAQRD